MTKKAKYQCNNGHEFVVEILEPGDLEELRKQNPNIRPMPVMCKECGSQIVKRVR